MGQLFEQLLVAFVGRNVDPVETGVRFGQIVRVGVDLVDVARIRSVIKRHPARFAGHVLTSDEARYCLSRPDPAPHIAARFAAKEALAKALGAPVGLAWHDAWIVSEETGRPRFELRGTVAARAEALGVGHVHVSLSHDAGLASAVVVLEA